MTVSCDRCKKEFDFQCRLDAHLSRKNKCRSSPFFECDRCNKQLKSKKALIYHQKESKLCKPKVEPEPEPEPNKDETIKCLLEQIEELKQINAQKQEIKTTVLNNHGVINNVNNVVNNIVVVLPYDSDACFQINNVDALQIIKNPTTEVAQIPNIFRKFRNIIEKGQKAAIELIKQTHFDENNPQLHNLLLQNLRHNELKIFNGKTWQTVSARNTLEQLLYDKTNTLIEMKEIFKNILPKNLNMDKLGLETKFMKCAEVVNADNDEENKILIANLLNDIKLCCYNNKELIKSTIQFNRQI